MGSDEGYEGEEGGRSGASDESHEGKEGGRGTSNEGHEGKASCRSGAGDEGNEGEEGRRGTSDEGHEGVKRCVVLQRRLQCRVLQALIPVLATGRQGPPGSAGPSRPHSVVVHSTRVVN